MAVKTCEEVMDGASYAGEGGKQVTRSSETGGSEGDFLDAVISAAGYVDSTATELYQYDCSDHLLEWLYKVCPQLKTVGNGIDKAVKKIGSITSGIGITDIVQNNSITQSICNVILTIFGNVTAWLEVLTKAAFALFSKIDAARERMQAALESLNGAVMNCVMDVYNMLEKYLTGLLNVALGFDWDALEAFLTACPCICRFIAFVTCCDTDADGNNISNEPDKVIHCIRDKFWFIDGANLSVGLSTIMNDYIKQYLLLLFDAINLGIESLFNLFIKPFRMLIKAYADFLRKQWDVSFLIEPLKASHLDCLLVYHKKVKDGKTIYTMSILNMIDSMKQWIGCLEYPCLALSERIKNKVKKFNEDFRLTGDYWNKEFEADIYVCCMRADAAYEQDISLEELGSLWGDLLDRLRSINSRAKNGLAFAKVTYGVEATGAIVYDTNSMRDDCKTEAYEESPVTGSSVKTAAQFYDSPERENDINVGSEPLTTQEDELIRAVGVSISNGCDEDTYFVEKWYQYLRFVGIYEISNNTVEKLREVRDKTSEMKANFSGGYETNFPVITRREPSHDEPDERGVNYWVDSDYNAEHIGRIQNIDWKTQMKGESLTSYYARMYASAG